ncbi:MAG TPA: substrate-binding domain-containing protein, partial [Acidimicrobiales bacterium]|nr:substrate-binding domain-containing protein [Acidimicrobiales bacterium]
MASAAVVPLALVLPAGALGVPTNVNYSGATATGAATGNNLIVGSGGSVSYQLMQALDTLFDDVPGCVITAGTVSGAPSSGSQQLNYSCETSTGVTGTPTAGTTLEQVPGNAYLDNPINDVAAEEPPTGSSNGIAQLELGRNQGNTKIGTSFTSTNPQQVAAINYARSSRDPSSSADVQGLNFVAYAKDGVAPLIFTDYSSAKTSFGKNVATNGLTTADLQDIYNGTIYDWGQLPGDKDSAPIFVYSAQEGSGTQSTFKTFLGFDPSSASNKVNCTDPVTAGTPVVATAAKGKSATFPGWTFPTSNTAGSWAPGDGPTSSGGASTGEVTNCLGPDVIFANETNSILANDSSSTEDALATAWSSNNDKASPVGDSIDYYPYGLFNLECEGLKEQVSYLDKSKTTLSDTKAGANCGSAPLPTGAKLTLTPVNGVSANPETILGTSGQVYPIDRFLYNVYSNGSNANIPAATAATLNYVSEVGFLCKAQTVNGAAETSRPATTYTPDATTNDIVDPTTGLWYHDEIYNTIVANGFIPVTATDSTTQFGGSDGLQDGPPI